MDLQRHAHVTSVTASSSSSSSKDADNSESVQQWFGRHSEFGALVVYTWLAITSASVVIVLMLVRYRREVVPRLPTKLMCLCPSVNNNDDNNNDNNNNNTKQTME